MKMKIKYIYRGKIERNRTYRWYEGFSENSDSGKPLYPWMTWRECQQDAKRRGGTAQKVYP